MRCAIALSLLIALPAVAQPTYTVTDLGRLPDYTYMTVARGMNNHGHVVGMCMNGATYKAFVWTPASGITALPPVPGYATHSSTATAINDQGDIVGFSGQDNGVDNFGWVYRNGTYTMLGTLPGMRGAYPSAINNAGEVVGKATPTSLLNPSDTFYWSATTGIVDITPGSVTEEVYDINDNGVACGGSRATPARGVLLWDMRNAGAETELPAYPDAAMNFGYSLNNAGHVAGVAVFIDPSSSARTSEAMEVPPGGFPALLGISRGVAASINASGVIAGWHPFSNNQTYYGWVRRPGADHLDLETTTGMPTIGHASGPVAINDAGQAIAQISNGAFPDSARRAGIFTPIVTCDTIDFNADGLFPDVLDIEDFLRVFAGGPCSTGTACGDIDFNNDGLFPDTADIQSLLTVFGGGGCQ